MTATSPAASRDRPRRRRRSSRSCTAGTARCTRSNGLTIDIAPGELIALLGPSGCGKTTALRALGGLDEVDQGTIVVGGKDITHVPANKRNMGIVFQAYSLFPNMTARDNVAYGLRLRGVDGDDAQEAGRRDARAGRVWGHRRSLPPPDVRRPAAARRARPGARDRAERAPARRAAVGARRQGPPPAPRGDPADPDHDRDHDAVRDPRPGGGARDGRPGRRDVGRAPRADRAADRAVRPAAGPRFVAEFVGPDQPDRGTASDGAVERARGRGCRSSRARPSPGPVHGARPARERPARPADDGPTPRVVGGELPRIAVPRPGRPAGRRRSWSAQMSAHRCRPAWPRATAVSVGVVPAPGRSPSPD